MKKATKPFISFIIFISLFVVILGMCLGFSLYTVGTPKVELNNVTITKIYNDEYGYSYINVEANYTANLPLNARVTLNIYRAEDEQFLRWQSTNIKTTKATTGTIKFTSNYVGHFSPLPTADFFKLTTEIDDITKVTTSLNYVGYALIPVSVCLAGFSAYSLVDFIKTKKEEKN